MCACVCMCMRVCMRVCACVCVCVRVSVSVYSFAFVYLCYSSGSKLISKIASTSSLTDVLVAGYFCLKSSKMLKSVDTLITILIIIATRHFLFKGPNVVLTTTNSCQGTTANGPGECRSKTKAHEVSLTQFTCQRSCGRFTSRCCFLGFSRVRLQRPFFGGGFIFNFKSLYVMKLSRRK